MQSCHRKLQQAMVNNHYMAQARLIGRHRDAQNSELRPYLLYSAHLSCKPFAECCTVGRKVVDALILIQLPFLCRVHEA